MKRLILHTTNYKNELINFTETAANHNLCTIEKARPGPQGYSTIFTWQAAVSTLFIQSLMHFLYSIAISQNPVYRHSPKLRHLAEGLQNTPLHKSNLKQLKAFLRAGNELHIDGYVTFRMEEYRQKLDMMLYTIVKKIRSNK